MKKTGLYVVKKDNKNILMYNGEVISATKVKDFFSLGLLVGNNTITIDDTTIATSVSGNSFSEDNDDLLFGGTSLTTKGECINITQANYNKLLAGEDVAGYKRYSSEDIYNIVTDVDGASTITYTIANNVITFSDTTTQDAGSNILYNNGTALTENTLDLEESINSTTPPFVSVRYFNPIIAPGDTITLTYFVDTYSMASLKHNDRSETFTVIIRDANGDTLVKKTSYAGLFTVETPAFIAEGETWFSVECIDSKGVGSVVQYFDILVRDEVVPNYYPMTENDLVTYGIVPNNSDPQVAYANKAAISSLFAYAKNEGYNGIVMLENTYYVDYHHSFGTQTYRKAKIDTSTKKIITISECTEQEVINARVRRTFKYNNSVVTGYSFAGADEDMTKWENEYGWIHADGDNKYIYYVCNTSTPGVAMYDRGISKNDDVIIFPDHFTVDLNGATIKAAPSTDIETGSVVWMDGNTDSHLINGTIEGNYDNYNFALSALQVGQERPAEWLNVDSITHSKYCSFRNLNIKNSVGYGSRIHGDVFVNAVAPTYSSATNVDFGNNSVALNNSMVKSQIINLNDCGEIRLAKGGYGGYNYGKHREILFVFYSVDNEDNSVYDYITTIKGKLYQSCKVPTSATHVLILGYGATSDFSDTEFKLSRGTAMSSNIIMDNCHYSNSGTCAIAPKIVKGLCYNHCTFTNIASEKTYKVTEILGDFEDGWQHLQNVAIHNCVVNKSDGHNELCIHFCNGFDFYNNNGITIYMNNGGLEYGFIFNNQMPYYKPLINKGCRNPFVYYKGNKIDELTITYNGDVSTSKDKTPVDPVVYMENTTIKDKCMYADLILRDSMNGDVWHD